ncbi:hypothetical protein KJ909_02315, partial [Patescibacteria group bacterium]|nr:hypothetical protein [Patescibacteria group bacterium]
CLYADFLPSDNQPGTHVRRINGQDEVDDEVLLKHWENLVKIVPPGKRTGYWHFAYCLVNNSDIKVVTRNFPVRFYYPASQIRISGWPLSSLQGSLGKPHSEYSLEEKQKAVKRDQILIRKLLSQKLFS